MNCADAETIYGRPTLSDSVKSTARSFGVATTKPTSIPVPAAFLRMWHPYISGVRGVLSQLPPSHVVEIGCGDFAVGARLSDLARTYTACDVVPELIERNRRMFVRENLRFVAVDAVTDPLPSGDLVIVKQVFQHLRNDQIQAILRKLAQYHMWIICEHIPVDSQFVPNADMLAGAGTRLAVNSGVVLTEKPFSVRPRSSHILSEVRPADGGVIRTLAYRF